MTFLRQRKCDRGVKKQAHNRAPKQEQQLAQRITGRTIKGSGSGDEKGDVRLKGVVRVEAKTTQKKSFSVTRDMVEKIEAAALAAGELPAIVVEFLDDSGRPTHELAVVPTYVLDMIVESHTPDNTTE